MVASVVEDLFQKIKSSFCFNKGGNVIEIIKIVGIALVATFLALIVKEQKPNFAFFSLFLSAAPFFYF